MSANHDLSALENPPYESSAAMMERLQNQKEAQAEAPKGPDPRAQEDYVFPFEWKNPQGKVWRGRFKNRVLSLADQQLVGALQSEYAMGKSYASLDPLTQEINLMVAWMSVSLDAETSPDWGKDLRTLKSVTLLQALYKEVLAHEATFHGFPTSTEGSQTGDQ